MCHPRLPRRQRCLPQRQRPVPPLVTGVGGADVGGGAVGVAQDGIAAGNVGSGAVGRVALLREEKALAVGILGPGVLDPGITGIRGDGFAVETEIGSGQGIVLLIPGVLRPVIALGVRRLPFAVCESPRSGSPASSHSQSVSVIVGRCSGRGHLVRRRRPAGRLVHRRRPAGRLAQRRSA